jgi:hypothetical protein
VTTHKKKRALCTEAERRDPYVVFPLSVFGCDALYERGFLVVRGGVILLGRAAPGLSESAIMGSLIGRELAPKWAAGPVSYFASRIDLGDLAADDEADDEADNELEGEDA